MSAGRRVGKGVLVCLAGLFLLAGGALYATEGGGGAYPTGAEGFMAGAVPPPGTYFINYFTYYSADKFMNANGDSAVPNFDLEVVANTFRLLHVTNKQVLGGFWGMHVFLPVVSLDVTVPGASDNCFGVGDMIIDPCILSWHSKNWHWVTGLDVYVPTGSYKKERLANLGRNYWTFEPVFAFTYLSDTGWEVSSKFMYDINTENEATDYTSGQEFHFDYLLGKKISAWSLGVGGYYYVQLTDDKAVGVDGNLGKVFAYGPQIKYDYKKTSFILAYQREDFAENKPEGNKLWFKFIYAF